MLTRDLLHIVAIAYHAGSTTHSSIKYDGLGAVSQSRNKQG